MITPAYGTNRPTSMVCVNYCRYNRFQNGVWPKNEWTRASEYFSFVWVSCTVSNLVMNSFRINSGLYMPHAVTPTPFLTKLLWVRITFLYWSLIGVLMRKLLELYCNSIFRIWLHICRYHLIHRFVTIYALCLKHETCSIISEESAPLILQLIFRLIGMSGVLLILAWLSSIVLHVKFNLIMWQNIGNPNYWQKGGFSNRIEKGLTREHWSRLLSDDFHKRSDISEQWWQKLFFGQISILPGLRVNGPLRQEKLSHVDIFRSAEPFVEKNLLQLRISYSAKYDCLYFI